MSDLQSIATAIEIYRIDNGYVPSVPSLGAAKRLEPDLVPTFIKELPIADAWSYPYEVESNGRSYLLRSRGRCSRPDVANTNDYVQGDTISFHDDLVIKDGRWLRCAGGHCGPVIEEQVPNPPIQPTGPAGG